MAKATAICTCERCGATFEKVAIKRNRTEADEWVSWATQNYTLCGKCWAEDQRQKEAAKPLTVTAKLDPYDGVIVLIFSGNTMPYKDAIKALGYRWDHSPMSGFMGPLSTNPGKMCWSKEVLPECFRDEIEKAKEIGAAVRTDISEIDYAAYVDLQKQKADEAAKLQAEQDAVKAKIEALGPAPALPAFLSGRWNGKVYGGDKRGYCVYLDGKEQSITAAQYVEIISYERNSKAYADAVAAIRSGK